MELRHSYHPEVGHWEVSGDLGITGHAESLIWVWKPCKDLAFLEENETNGSFRILLYVAKVLVWL